MNKEGLTAQQVAARIAAGKVNKLPKKATSKTIPQIILTSTFTLFNFVNLVLALLIILVGSYKNLLFILIAVANTAISIINEIRAKRTIDKLKLQSEQNPTVIRDGQIRQIPPDKLVEGDLMILSLGDQILVDATVQSGEIEVNESFITGEQDNITKTPGDKLISGSFVVSGTCRAVVTSVGASNYLTKLEASAKTIKPSKSQLFTIMNNIVKYISFALIPIGILLLARQLAVQDVSTEFETFPHDSLLGTIFASHGIEIAVTSTVAALINMIPEGLILLTSSVLALATIRLSKKQVLVQDLYSIETLARVDTICLDKTGTLTTGHMHVVDLLPNYPIPESKTAECDRNLRHITSEPTSEPISEPSLKPAKPSEKAYASAKNALENAFKAILSHSTSDNATSTALKAKLLKTPKSAPTAQNAKKSAQKSPYFDLLDPPSASNVEVIPFSSDRKYSGLRTKNREILMGALEFITKNPTLLAEAETLLENVEHPENYRIISVVEKSYPDSSEILLGLALLEDEIRPDAPEIVQYFAENDVATKIISGDNLETVVTIAKKVGVPGAEQAVDLSKEGTRPNFDRLVRDYNIFTRVTPGQKKRLIAALKKQGHIVAMTGDGVNDILAMQEADCSIAIGAGADAARRTARLVLLDSNFASVPNIIAEGRQTINNLERSTSLFLSKTIYASILAVLFVIFPLEYPYSPIEMTLLNFLCIGFPGFVLALEKNTARVKDRFVKNIRKFSVPTGLSIAFAMLVLATLDHLLPKIIPGFALSRPDLLTISMVITFLISASLIYRISKPLNHFRATLLGLIIAIFLLVIFIPPLRLIFTS